MNVLALRRKVKKAQMCLKGNAPELIGLASAIGVVGSCVLSVIGYKKSQAVSETHEEKMTELREKKEEFEDSGEYNKEVTKVYFDTAKGYIVSYGPAVLSAGLTITGIFASNKILKKRCIQVGAAYTGLKTAFDSYRARVAEELGEDAEEGLYHGVKRTEVVETVTDKKGAEKVKVETIHEVNGTAEVNSNLDYIFLSPNSPYWYRNNPTGTLYYIRQQEKFFTQKLRSVGYVFVNEIREAFGLNPIPEGQVVGFIYNENSDENDNIIDFGLREGSENLDFFLKGKNDFIYLTINHDGVIYEKFPFFDRVGKSEY